MKEKKIPVIMASGYLGSGKTTLLSHLLNSQFFAGKKIAVLVNEFGQLPIDGALLPKGDYFLAEINKGSIFCVCVKTDLLRDLEKIARNIQPDILLIEATGVAEPRDISLLIDTPFLKDSYGDSLIITLVDAINYPKLSTILPALKAQVASADIVLINKVDCVDDNEIKVIEDNLKKINPVALYYHSVNAVFPFNEHSFSKVFKNNTLKNSDEKLEKLCQIPPINVYNCELRKNIISDKIAFYNHLDKYRNMILRGKGIIDFGSDKKYVEIINGTVFSKPANMINLTMDTASGMSFVLRISPEEFLAGFDNL